jgi:hypothetical protein
MKIVSSDLYESFLLSIVNLYKKLPNNKSKMKYVMRLNSAVIISNRPHN